MDFKVGDLVMVSGGRQGGWIPAQVMRFEGAQVVVRLSVPGRVDKHVDPAALQSR